MNNIHRPRVAKRPLSRIEGEPFDPKRVSTTLNAVVARNVREEAARTERLLDSHNWGEHAMSDCTYGCKVYRHRVSGETQVFHHRVYGCPKG